MKRYKVKKYENVLNIEIHVNLRTKINKYKCKYNVSKYKNINKNI